MAKQPVFKKVLQVGIVVHDLEKAVRTYADDFGIGPWQFYNLDKSNMHDMKMRGEKAEFSMKVAFTDLGGVQLELIEPLDESIYSDFLREHGEGIHHIACGVRNFEETMASMQKKDIKVLLEGTTSAGMGYVYLDTTDALSCITEIYRIPENLQYIPPDKTYP
ncbi:methylmalonyl-CoA epimerase family protein [Geobacter metallireducens GS-15]|uniref:Methylmalonyl-CoA epimerase family protein n=1 Tax=Geobacter metallireducens (strain ATCC 53774 / DSM 7210 / GS-15) TaxID=269799 RepID=Q39TG0_GEOMG|nr:VOC family protein [Geobacter metallireducens]ABB32464.1 methylmalonyl-CoA epimerase family protein [Geobacter metallireducens GS-15]